MSKPLRLFIENLSDWTLVHSYGPTTNPPSPPAHPTFHDYVLLHTAGAGKLLAAVDGKLSITPPDIGIHTPTLPLTFPDDDMPLPPTVNLYLHISPAVVSQADFQKRSDSFFQIVGFAYFNIETASLEETLAELLDNAMIPPGALLRSQVVDMLIRGHLDTHIPAGNAIGVASSQGAPTGFRQVGFTVLTSYGTIDPAYIYDWYRDFVNDGQSAVDNLLQKIPIQWPVLDTAFSTNECITKTQHSIYPMTVLEELRTSRNLTRTQWRQVGDNQKDLYRDRLLQRAGHAPAGSTDPPFEFNDLDWCNIFQLEAVVEFYANFNDPWADNATPLNPGDPGLDFLDLAGSAATVNGQCITLDGGPDLNRVTVDHDVIVLSNATNRTSRTYRITGKTDTSVQVDIVPEITGNSTAWEIRLKPTLVIIDPFGGRLQGKRAIATANVVTFEDDPPPDLTKVNPHFDTIYLPSDTANHHPSRTYRIVTVDNANHTVTLGTNDNPNLDGGSSAWHIQAGISGKLPNSNYNLGPGTVTENGVTQDRGYDHYDGALFIIKGGELRGKYRWSSYTSRNYNCDKEKEEQLLSSIRGNQQYDVNSLRSTNDFKNYSFKVVDQDATYDGVSRNRFYFYATVGDDSAPTGTNPVDGGAGKTEIRLHRGTQTAPEGGSGSAGCLTSPEFESFRTQMILLYQNDYQAVNGSNNLEVQKLSGLDLSQSKALWNTTQDPTSAPEDKLKPDDWDDYLKAVLWLIRPDERPLG